MTDTTAPAQPHAQRAPSLPWYAGLLDNGRLPDWLVRSAIRRKLRGMLREMRAGGVEAVHERHRAFVRELASMPVAIRQDAANEQHYEAPPAFFELCLGARLKYSCGLWTDNVRTLDEAEEAALTLACERARLEDGQRILELGCGWGSLSIWMAQRYPRASITSISNSAPQRRFIEAKARSLGLTNLTVITADAATFDPADHGAPPPFDRVVSIEMFEHMKNYGVLLERISTWLAPEGRLFVHIFTHRDLAYHFNEEGDYLGRFFFTGGTMPSHYLLHEFNEHMRVTDHWRVSGRHYEKTANAWLRNLDDQRERARAALAESGSPDPAEVQRNRWRLFFMACAEFWGFDGGNEWFVSHYLLAPRSRGKSAPASGA